MHRIHKDGGDLLNLNEDKRILSRRHLYEFGVYFYHCTRKHSLLKTKEIGVFDLLLRKMFGLNTCIN